MKISLTFSRYIVKKFSFWVTLVSFVFCLLVSLFNMLELSRRAYNKPDIKVSQLALLSFYQLPEIFLQLLPFIVLFATMILFWQMNRRLELVVARSVGFSIWSILSSLWVGVMGLSLINFVVLNPIGAEFSSRFDHLERRIFSGRSGMLMVSETGIWLKQEGYTTYSLVRVARVDPKKEDLQDVSIYTFDLSNHFVNRLDASSVSIHPQGWLLKNVCLSRFNEASQTMGDMLWKTDLTIHKIQESFAKPTSLPLWKLPSFIHLMEEAGLSTVEHSQYFYKSLLQPFLLMVMAMLACLCAYHFTRHKGGARFVVSGLLSGFIIFFIQKISHALGLATTLSPLLSVILPILFGTLVSVGMLMHLEEK